MKMPFLVLAFIYVCGLATASAQQQGDRNDDKQLEALIREWRKTINDKTLQTKEKEKVQEAILLLGHFRVQEALPDLVELVEFTANPGAARGIMSPLERYPALRALKEIGKPSLPALTRAIADRDRSAQYSANALHVLRLLLGSRGEVKAYLAREIAKEKDKERANRLKSIEKGIVPEYESKEKQADPKPKP